MREFKSLLITGAAGEIGKGLINELSDIFVNLYCIDINPSIISYLPNNVIFEQHDLTKGFSTNALDYISANSCNGLCMLNLLGFIESRTFVDLTWSESDHFDNFTRNSQSMSQHFEIDFCLPISLSIELANAVIAKRGYSSIVNLSSISALGNVGQSVYSSMKSAVETSTIVLAKEFGPFDIRFNCLAPGFLNTSSMLKSIPIQSITKLKRDIPLRQFGSVSCLVPALKSLFFSEYINGHTLRVDGGYTL